jgi:hypothetical protein
MQLGPEDAAAAVERHSCTQCGVPAGGACRTAPGNRRESTTLSKGLAGACWLAAEARQRADLDVDVIDLADDLPLPG